LSPKFRGAVVPRGHFANKDLTFNYKNINFPYEEVQPEDVRKMLKEGWIILDVREELQVERAKMQGAVEVPLYVLKNEMSPMGIYQEMISFGLGGWWMGGRPMKENHDFVSQVERRLNKNSKILAVCQGGLRAKQALKELHLAGFKNLAMVKGGLKMVRNDEIPCDEEGCRLDLAGSGNVAGMLGWHVN
jgi:rhodanese-related sulfurtransferase